MARTLPQPTRLRRGRPPLHTPEREPVHDVVHAAGGVPRRERKRKGGQGADEFAFDMDQIPEGMTYEWKRIETLGARDPSYEVLMAEQGWTPVPLTRHPNYMPKDFTGPIMRKGLMLMERPDYLTEEARREAERDAFEVVRTKEEQLGMTPSGTLPRKGAQVSKSFEPMEIPE